MSEPARERLLEALLDSWDRNNAIMVGLIRALPDGALALRSVEGSASIARAFTHMYYIRLVHVFEDGRARHKPHRRDARRDARGPRA